VLLGCPGEDVARNDPRPNAQGEPQRLLLEGQRPPLYVKDFGGDENFHVVSVATDGSGIKDLTPSDGVQASIVDHLEDDDAPSACL
jgi:hypothetical protein